MKSFVIPSEVNGQKVPVQFCLGEPTKHIRNPIHFQAAWLKQERGVDVPANVKDSLTKLREIAIIQNISCLDLCTYALNYPKQ
jgi:hypothetical protein